MLYAEAAAKAEMDKMDDPGNAQGWSISIYAKDRFNKLDSDMPDMLDMCGFGIEI